MLGVNDPLGLIDKYPVKIQYDLRTFFDFVIHQFEIIFGTFFYRVVEPFPTCILF